MARIVAISSQVARGAVGLSIVTPALQALGHEVIALPTVMLSNHPGHPRTAGFTVDPGQLVSMLDAIEANGWLDGVEAVISGYLPSAGHVDFAAEAVRRVRTRRGAGRSIYVCDPVLGDFPKGLYIDPHAAAATRDRLLPIADVITPNRFELEWLTGGDADAASALGLVRGPAVVATSMPDADPAFLRNIAHGRDLRAAARVRQRAAAPHGTGDLFAALLVAGHAEGKRLDLAMASATAGVDQVLAASNGFDALAVRALPQRLSDLPAWAIEPVSDTTGGERRS